MLGMTAIQFFVFSVVVFVIAFWVSPKKTPWLPYIILIFLFVVLAFNFAHNNSDDLWRYYQQLDYIRDLGYEYVERCIDEGFMEWDIYRSCAYYFYLVSLIPNNHHLPALTVAITYWLLFRVLYKAAKRFEIDKINYFIASLFFISTYWYYDLASGIRNGLCFAIIFASAYQHMVERKHILLCLLGYVVAAFLHSSGALMIALVFLAFITKSERGRAINAIYVFGLVGGSLLIQFLADRTNNGFVQSIAGRAESNQGNLIAISTWAFANFVVLIIVAAVLIYVLPYILNSTKADRIKRFYRFSSMVVLFTVGCFKAELIFVRLIRWIFPVIGALFYMVGIQEQNNMIRKVGLNQLLYQSGKAESIRIQASQLFKTAFVAFTAVHFWYLCRGSSLYWMHF